MKLYRPSEIPKAPVSSPLFTGEVLLQDTPMPEGALDYTLRVVTYTAGARNVPHRHTSDQLIVVTAGKGLVGANGEEFEVHPGEVVIIPASEWHWHGAGADGDVTQVSVTSRTSTTEAQPQQG
jgi:quercetin dioxygenase-like cupin family protein